MEERLKKRNFLEKFFLFFLNLLKVPTAFNNVSDICKLTLGTLTETEKDMFEEMDDDITATASMMKNIWWFVGLGATEWIVGWIGTWLLMLSAENQINRIRK